MLVDFPVHVGEDSPFPIENIPFGVFSTERDPRPRIGTIIGDHVVDLQILASKGLLNNLSECNGGSRLAPASVFSEQTLNAFAAQGGTYCSAARQKIIDLLSDPGSALFTNDETNQMAFIPVSHTTMHLPMQIGGFTDFLCSEVHAENCARLAGQSLHPSFHAFPTAYNGRSSSVVVSGTPIKRPRGMVRDTTGAGYAFKLTTKFDFELELGVFVSKAVAYGDTVVTVDDAAAQHIFGFVLLNDWSARDVQFAEMVPLGPFNGKATATTISPWVIMPDALRFAGCAAAPALSGGAGRSGEEGQVSLLPRHLRHRETKEQPATFDIELAVAVIDGQAGPGAPAAKLCQSNLRHLRWTPAQMLAHHASSGCGLQTGDLLGTGTVSGPGSEESQQYHDHDLMNRGVAPTATPTLGCLFELTDAGKKGIMLPSGRKFVWVEDGDEIVLAAWARGKGGRRIGFGDARGVVVPE